MDHITPVTHLYLLLDRSGSMESIRADVIGGFNRFLAAQQRDGEDALVTLVQFDSVDPQEVVHDAVPVADVAPLDDATFVPRGGTPLLDATGLLLARAKERAARRAKKGKAAEEILFVTITDGEENQSREVTREQLVRRITRLEAKGWTFAFLSAGLDAYGEARGMGIDRRATQAFAPSPAGAAVAFDSLSRATTAHRAKLRRAEAFDKGDFFEGRKEAEE